MKKIVCYCACLLVLWLTFHFGRKSAEPEVVKIVQTDTVRIVRTDTVKIIKPEPYQVVVRDTVYLQLPQIPQPLIYETKIYQDSTYMAQVSGIDAQLDYIETYNKTIIREITKIEQIKTKPKKWGIGVHAGYSFIAGQFRPYVGVGLSYNFVVF